MHFDHMLIFFQRYRGGGANFNALGEETKSSKEQFFIHIMLVSSFSWGMGGRLNYISRKYITLFDNQGFLILTGRIERSPHSRWYPPGIHSSLYNSFLSH